MDDGELVRAMFAFEISQPGDLGFDQGDIITVLEKNENGWWYGRTNDGREGIFPYNRVEKLKFIPPQSPPRPKFQNVPVESANNNKITGVDVAASSDIVDKKGYVKFEIILWITPGSKKLSAWKTMKDFRKLNACIELLSPLGHTEFNISLPPQWADKAPMSTLALNNRAANLENFLYGATTDVLMGMVIYWMDQSFELALPTRDRQRIKEAFQESVVHPLKMNKAPVLARTLYPWTQRDDMEISLDKYEVIAVLDQKTQYEGWWLGEKTTGKRGVFPYNYVELMEPEEARDILIERPTIKENMKKKVKSNSRIGKQVQPDSQNARQRRRIQKYAIGEPETFDELLKKGVAMEANGKLVQQASKHSCPNPGDLVRLKYNAYIWEPQKQQLLEFASSDQLLDAKPEESGPLEFIIGKGETIEGLEMAVQMMEKGQNSRAIIHPNKAYGDVGSPPIIPMNAYLVYDLTLEMIGGESDRDAFRKKGPSLSTRIVGIGKAKVAKRPSRTSIDLSTGFNPNSKKSLAITRNRSRPDRPDMEKPSLALQRYKSNQQIREMKSRPDAKKYKGKMTLKQLRDIMKQNQTSQYGMDPECMEEYLTDAEFKLAFGVDRITFILMPWYKQKELKSKAGLKPRPGRKKR